MNTILSFQFPDRITHVIYDRLATQPQVEARRLLNFTGIAWNHHIQSWLYNNTKGETKGKVGNVVKMIQRNSTQIVSKWRQRINKRVLHGINSACKGLYKIVENVPWPDINI